jgi:hypothetical protein
MKDLGELRSLLASSDLGGISVLLGEVGSWGERRRLIAYTMSWADRSDYDLVFKGYGDRFRNIPYEGMIFRSAWSDTMFLFLRRRTDTYGKGFVIARLQRWHRLFFEVSKEVSFELFGWREDTCDAEASWEHFKATLKTRGTSRPCYEIFKIIRALHMLCFKGCLYDGGPIVPPRALPKHWIRLISSLSDENTLIAQKVQSRFLKRLQQDFFA